MRTYAIGDIHGQIDMLREVHSFIERDRKLNNDDGAPVVHLGDLVDRGPDSKGVIQFLIDGIEAGENWVVLKGNHDRMFSWYLGERPRVDPHLYVDLDWLHYRLGGAETLRSYGIEVNEGRRQGDVHSEARASVPQSHIDLLNSCPLSYLRGEVQFVHAGIRPKLAMSKQSENDLVWIREEFLDSYEDHGPLIAHGHTALLHATRYPNRVNLDSSAAFGHPLTAAVFEGRDVWRLNRTGREEIPMHEVPRSLPEAHIYRR